MRTIHQMYTDNICIIYKAVGVVEDVQNRLLSSNMLMICIDGELELSIDSSPALKWAPPIWRLYLKAPYTV